MFLLTLPIAQNRKQKLRWIYNSFVSKSFLILGYYLSRGGDALCYPCVMDENQNKIPEEHFILWRGEKEKRRNQNPSSQNPNRIKNESTHKHTHNNNKKGINMIRCIRRDKNRETGAGCTIRKLMTPENHFPFLSNFSSSSEQCGRRKEAEKKMMISALRKK